MFKILLETWQGVALRKLELDSLRFPLRHFSDLPKKGERVSLFEGGTFIQNYTVTNVTEQSFCEIKDTFGIAKREGFLCYQGDESYSEVWNRRFSQSLYSKNLKTILIEIDKTLTI